MPYVTDAADPARCLRRDPIRDTLATRRLIVASNRGPVEHRLEDGVIVKKRGSGGVVTALSAVADHTPVTWVASAMTDGDRLVARMALPGWDTTDPDHTLGTRFVVAPDHAYDKHYNVVCNPVLWFVQHGLVHLLEENRTRNHLNDAWLHGYVPVNRAFAKAIVTEASRCRTLPIVMLHDYHLYLVAKSVRRMLPNVVLHHFVHIPWPEPQLWQWLPRNQRSEIIEGLCYNDIIGFQTRRSLKNFLASCRAFLEGAEVDFDQEQVRYQGHVARARVYPITIDTQRVLDAAQSPAAMRHVERLRHLCGEHTLVRVDRLDPSKNIVRGFEAFDLLLARHKGLIGKIKFLNFLVPCRTDVPEYRRYRDQALNLARAINDRYSTDGWRPIEVLYENNYEQALAGMQLYDVLMVNPVQDGMNLVVKEGALVNRKDGVVVLSDRAGAYEQLRRDVLPIDPLSIEQTAEALYLALTMPAEMRKQRASALRRTVEADDIATWLREQFDDLRPLLYPRAVPAPSANVILSRVAGSQSL